MMWHKKFISRPSIKTKQRILTVMVSIILALSFMSVCTFQEDKSTSTWATPPSPTSSNYLFSFVWLSDTQNMAEFYPNVFKNLTTWIAQHKDQLKIKYVIVTGDIVNDGDNDTQLQNAVEALEILKNAGIEVGLLLGNHDEFNATKAKQYYKEIDPDVTEPYHYDIVEHLGFILVDYSYVDTAEFRQYARSILQQYSDKYFILAAHHFISTEHLKLSNLHQAIATENVIMAICGHDHASFPIDGTLLIDGGSIVRTVLRDYQSWDYGGPVMTICYVFKDRIEGYDYSPYPEINNILNDGWWGRKFVVYYAPRREFVKLELVRENSTNPWATSGNTMGVGRAADLNEDGEPEIIVLGQKGFIVYDEQFNVIKQTYPNGENYGYYWSARPIVADLLPDSGKEMVLLGSSNITILNSTYDIKVTAKHPTLSFSTNSYQQMAVGDVNGDGSPEIVVANISSKEILIYNVSLSNIANITAASSVYSVAVGDLNNDGENELWVGTALSPTNPVQIFNTSLVNFYNITYDIGWNSPISVIRFCDFDGDGDTEVWTYSHLHFAGQIYNATVYSNRTVGTERIISFAKYNGTNGFGYVHGEIIVNDIDSDGIVDFIMSARDSNNYFTLFIYSPEEQLFTCIETIDEPMGVYQKDGVTYLVTKTVSWYAEKIRIYKLTKLLNFSVMRKNGVFKMEGKPWIYNNTAYISNLDFTDQRLHIVLEGPTGVTGTTVIYCPYEPVMIFEDGELKTTNYIWNSDTKLLTVNVTFSSPVNLDIYFAVPKLESYDIRGEFLGYVFPGTQTVELNLKLYSESSQVSQDTRIILEVYNMDGASIYSTAKRETLTQEVKTVTFNIPDLEPGTYLIKVVLQNPDTGETLNTYSFLLKVTYPWWLWAAIIAIIIAIIGIAIMVGRGGKLFRFVSSLSVCRIK